MSLFNSTKLALLVIVCMGSFFLSDMETFADNPPQRIFTYTSDSTAFENSGAWLDTTKSHMNFNRVKFTCKGDYNGDQKEDIAIIYSEGFNSSDRQKIYVSLSDGTSFGSETAWFDNPNEWFTFSVVPFVVTGDFNGDGMDDIAVLYDYPDYAPNPQQTVFVFLSNGNSFQTYQTWFDTTKSNLDFNKIKFVTCGDYNNDNRDDIAFFYNEGAGISDRQKILVMLSNESSFGNPVAWFDHPNEWFSFGVVPFVVTGDFNGDGIDDIAALYDYPDTNPDPRQTVFVFPSNGSGFSSYQTWYDTTKSNLDFNKIKFVCSGQYDTETPDDIAFWYNEGTAGADRQKIYIITSLGNSFSNKEIWFDTPNDAFSFSYVPFSLSGDFTGDSLSDIAMFYDYPDASPPAYYYGYWEGAESYENYGFIRDNILTNYVFSQPEYLYKMVNNCKFNNIIVYLHEYLDGDRNSNGIMDMEEESYWPTLFDDIADEFKDYENKILAFYLIDEPYAQVQSLSEYLDSDKDNFDFDKIKFTLAGDYNGDNTDDLSYFYSEGEAGSDRQKILITLSESTSSDDSSFGSHTAWFDHPNDWFTFSVVPFAVTGDFNGDGKDDIAALYDYPGSNSDTRQAIFVFLSNGNGFQTYQAWLDTTKANLDFDKIKLVNCGDYNGDNRDDIAIFYNEGPAGTDRQKIYILLSNGTSFDSPVAWFDMPNEWFSFTYVPFVDTGDFNGDGKDDIAVLYDYPDTNPDPRQTIFVFPSNGSGFSAYQTWLDTTKSNLDFDNIKFVLAGERDDYNGANWDDISIIYDYPDITPDPFGDTPQRIFVYLSSGSQAAGGFLYHGAWLNSTTHGFAFEYVNHATIGDFNGDSLDDLAMLYDYPDWSGNPSQRVFVTESTGRGAFASKDKLERLIDACKSRFPSIPTTIDFMQPTVMLGNVIPANIDWITMDPYPFFKDIPLYPDTLSWQRYDSHVNAAVMKLQADFPDKPVLLIGQSFCSDWGYRMPNVEEENWYYDTVKNFDLLGLMWFKYNDSFFGDGDYRNVYGVKHYPELIDLHRRIGEEIVIGISNNSAPVITSSPVTSANENALYQYDVNATDTDGDTLTYSLTQSPSGMSIDAATGLISWTPGQVHVGTHNITVEVNDGNGGSDTQTYSLDVQNINDDPIIITSPVTTALEDQLYQYDVNATDGDGDALIYVLTQSPPNMTIDSLTGILSWTPVQLNVGSHSISLQVDDGYGGYDTQSYTLAVSNVNDAPVIASGPTAIPNPVDENQTSTITVSATDEDGDILSYSWSVTGGSISGSGSSVTYNPPDVDTQTNHTISITVSDGNGGSATGSMVIVVNPVSGGTEQTPWQTNENGRLYTGIRWNYTMGYHFTPQKNGQITKLGGFFNGTKTVYLWNKDTRQLLAQTQVTSANNWNYMEINPVSVTAGTTYTVAAYLAGSGGTYRSSIATLPKTYEDIAITGTTYRHGNKRPTKNITTRMYGQADICFIPDGEIIPKIAQWPMDEGTGSIIYDATNNNNDGIISGASWTTGIAGQALDFDGSNNYVNCGNDVSLDITEELTVSAWVNYGGNQPNWGNILAKGKYTAQYDSLAYGLYSDINTTKISFQVIINQTYKGVHSDNLGTGWHHVAGTYTSGDLRLYVDGVQVAQDTNVTGSIQTTTENLYIGAESSGGSNFDGKIDEVKIFKRALSASEIQAEYEADKP